MLKELFPDGMYMLIESGGSQWCKWWTLSQNSLQSGRTYIPNCKQSWLVTSYSWVPLWKLLTGGNLYTLGG